MAVFPILKKRVMTPKIPQPQYRLAASISIKGRQVESAPRSPAGRPDEAAHRPLLVLPQLPPAACCLCSPGCLGQLASKDPGWIGTKAKTIFFQKETPSPDTWLCQIRSIIVSIRYLQCDMGQNTANIYSQSAVEVQSNNRKLFFLCNVASTV